MSNETETEFVPSPDIAIIGMAGRFPGADDLQTFWKNIREGVESISFFSDEELRAAGVPDELISHPDYVPAIGKLSDIEHFDAGFFGYSPREAELLEPAHRLFLEVAWETIEGAGYDAGRVKGNMGVYAGVGSSHYTDSHVRSNPALMATVGEFQVTVGSGKDFLATRVSYKLNLRGPSLAVQTGCSTSLVAVHLACQSLLHGECDMALAGGAAVNVPQVTGYVYQHGSILSPDGHCRAFDAKAAGAQAGSGVGAVLLKRLDDALADGDTVHAVIRGSAINNDGSVKVAYTAPSVEGQAAVITEALAVADVDPDSVTYIEAHGTGTDMGDPIEIAALTRAYRASTERKQYCAVGSVKTNIGHLDTAAGIAGLIKAVLALKARELPPTVHFEAPNPKIDFASSPFYVSGKLQAWDSPDGTPRRAGVSSFGIGGTNCHVILEEAPRPEPSEPGRTYQLLPLSARSRTTLDAATDRLAAHLRAHADTGLADAAFTLQEGRRAFSNRRFAVVREGEDVASVLESRTPDRVPSAVAEAGHRSVAFLFPGLGDHYANMGRGLYESEPVFRAEVDRCAEILKPVMGLDIREVLFPGDAPADPGAQGGKGGFDLRAMLNKEPAADPNAERLNRTEIAQPAVFVVSYALAKLWMSLGIEPEAVIGHSLGEYTAATISGVLELEDALRLVAERARMIGALPGGAMLAVSAAPEVVEGFLTPDIQIATVNAPQLCVVAGPNDAMAELEGRLTGAGHVSRRLPTTHAFHSAMMEPVVERFTELVRRANLQAPKVPFVSNLTGTWITAEQATDPRYWARHLRETVRFDQGVAELLREPNRVLLEVGPGQTLSTFVRQRPAAEGASEIPIVPSIRYPYDRTADEAFLLGALGRLWLAGVEPEWSALRAGESRRRATLPTYPWDRQRYWVEAPRHDPATAALAGAVRGKKADPAAWLFVPSWKRTGAPAASSEAPARWVVFGDGDALAGSVSAELAARGGEVVQVRAGDSFARAGDGFVVRPAVREDYRALAEAMGGEGALGVVHLWAAGPAGDAQERGYVSLALLADAIGRDRTRKVSILAVTAGTQDVTGGEEIRPARATALGAVRTIPQEYPGVVCRALDVDAAAPAAAVARQVADEAAASPLSEPVVALRARRRWSLGWEQVRPAASGPRIRQGGTYLLTHSLTGRGAMLADHLARAHGATLVLVDAELPARGGWLFETAARVASDPVRKRIEAARMLEEAGAKVHVVSASLDDAGALAAALRQAEEAVGPIHGVIVGTGTEALGQFATLADTAPEAWQAQVSETVAELDVVERALDGRALDFCLVDSSLAGALGAPGFPRASAMNQVADAFCAAHNARSETPWTAVEWDLWGTEADSIGEHFITPQEAPRAFEHVLSLGGESLVLVSTGDLNLRAADSAASARRAAEVGSTAHARPDLGHDYHAPTNEVEERITDMWQELLGIAQIGIHDDFFSLGGHSLLATQIISRVRDMFQLELPLKAIFEAPTPAKFAVLIEEAIIAELDEISEEEALQLL